MRRKDREITAPDQICAVIKACDCCRIGLVDGHGVVVQGALTRGGKYAAFC